MSTYARVTNAWCMYDWANSAFVTTVMAALFPPFFRSLVTAAGLPENRATAYWGYTASLAILIVALLAPLLGATADATGGKKRYLAVFAGVGILFTASFSLLGDASWIAASWLYVAAAIGFSGSIIFYESLLPHVARADDMDRVSARGYALGYVGGGLLLSLNLISVMRPSLFGLADAGTAVRLSFVSVSVWWFVFSIPFFRHVPEPPFDARDGRGPVGAIRDGAVRLAVTFREVRKHRHLLVFLLAFWVYSDGTGTIVRMATAYGDEIGIRLTDMVIALVITQFVGIPCTLLFGRMASRVGAKRSILIALGVYSVVGVGAYWMSTAIHFYALALAVGTVQGGVGALSRSLYASMVPRDRSAEFFGFFSASSKFAGMAGPFVFGLVSHAFGSSRLSIVSVVIFFVVGALILGRVDVEAGALAARRAADVPAGTSSADPSRS